MVVLSFIGIVISLVIIVVGSLKGHSLILISSLAALVCALTGAFATAAIEGGGTFWQIFYDGYAIEYMKGVADIIIQLFPLFLGGQMFGRLLEKTGLPVSVANVVFKKIGVGGTVAAVYIATLLLSVGGINVYVIIFTMYSLAAAFYKKAGISRSLIPANILGAAVAEQALPGVPTFNLVIPAQALGVSPSAGFAMGIVAFLIIGGLNFVYLNYAAKKSIKSGEGFVDKDENSGTDLTLDNENLPNPLLLFVPLVIVIVLMNAFGVPAWAALFVGCVVIAIMFYKRLGGSMNFIINSLAEGAESSQVVMSTGALCGIATLIGSVPGYSIVVSFLEKSSFGSPYIMAAVAVGLLAGFAGSALGGIQFVLANFADKFVAMGASPAALTRIMAVSALTLDSLPHNSANILTFQYCKVTYKEGYIHLVFCTVLTTLLATIVTVIMSQLGIY
ncbi:hypothetical protein AALB16_14425 [Lachnospiraceae bacterium 62-35]